MDGPNKRVGAVKTASACERNGAITHFNWTSFNVVCVHQWQPNHKAPTSPAQRPLLVERMKMSDWLKLQPYLNLTNFLLCPLLVVGLCHCSKPVYTPDTSHSARTLLPGHV